MLFWCDCCEETFEAEPNSDHYEQADCPNCGGGCLTFATEYQDAKNRASQGSLATTLMPGFLGSLFRLFGGGHASTPAILAFAAKAHYGQTVVSTFPALDDAQKVSALLRQRGVESTIDQANEKWAIYVDDGEASIAERIIHSP